ELEVPGRWAAQRQGSEAQRRQDHHDVHAAHRQHGQRQRQDRARARRGRPEEAGRHQSDARADQGRDDEDPAGACRPQRLGQDRPGARLQSRRPDAFREGRAQRARRQAGAPGAPRQGRAPRATGETGAPGASGQVRSGPALMRVLAVLPALLAASAVFAADGELSAGAGSDYSKGNYGTGSETKILSIPFMARYDSDPWKLKLTVPYLRVTGQGDVIPGIGKTNRGQRGETTESGIGDTVLAGTYGAFYDAQSKLGFDLTAKLKLPTGDEQRGLGTGPVDQTLQLEGYKGIDRLTVFGTLGYTHFGDSDVVEL